MSNPARSAGPWSRRAPRPGFAALAVVLGACSNTDTVTVWTQSSSDVQASERDASAGPAPFSRPPSVRSPDAGASPPEAPPSDPRPARLVLEPIASEALSTPVEGCHLASPIALEDGFATAAGSRVRAFSVSGELRWESLLPAPDGERAFVVATPVRVGSRLVVAYHTVGEGVRLDVASPRLSQRLVVLDERTGAVDAAHAPLVFDHVFSSADDDPVPFRADHALGRSALVTGRVGTSDRVLVSFGNARDIQPWHGFAFEVDLQSWRGAGPSSALSGALAVTPETECGREGTSGSTERRCGGGLWAPSGPMLVQEDGGYTAILAPGNGSLPAFAGAALSRSRRVETAARRPRAEIRVAAAAALRGLDAAQAETLADRLREDMDSGVRKAALRAVGKVQAPRLRRRLEGLSQSDPEPFVRSLAQSGLDEP